MNYSKGIYQAIGAFACSAVSQPGELMQSFSGYKEFDPFLTLRHRDPSRTLENDPELRKLFEQGVEEMKASTRQYAKRQVQWIKNKLLPVVRDAGEDVTVVLLDATGEPALFDPPRMPR